MELGNLIAERTLILRMPNGESEEVTIQVGAPQPAPDGFGWLCPWRLHRESELLVRYAAGVDAYQTLELVTAMIQADLFALNTQYRGGSRWQTGESYFPER